MPEFKSGPVEFHSEKMAVDSSANKELVKLATVKVLHDEDGSGQGVLVPGGLVLTAAHCISWSGTGGTALGDYHPTGIVTADGHRFRLEVYAAEPRADIAVLAALDDQEFPGDSCAFEDWCEATTAVPIRTAPFEPGTPGTSIRVHVLSHRGVWIPGTVTRWGDTVGGSLFLEADEYIEGGTSGGPVVDDDGLLVGVVSNSAERGISLGGRDAKFHGDLPLACMALPHWALLRATNLAR